MVLSGCATAAPVNSEPTPVLASRGPVVIITTAACSSVSVLAAATTAYAYLRAVFACF